MVNWLKRRALKWLINDRNFYHIMSAIRGPDAAGSSDHAVWTEADKAKAGFVAPLRGLIGMNRDLGADVSYGKLELLPGLLGSDSIFTHFYSHVENAQIALEKVGYEVEYCE